MSDARKRKRDRPGRPARPRKKPPGADDETPSPAADPLQALVARLQPIADLFTDGVYVLGTDGRFVYVNGVIEERSGMPLDDWRRRTYLDVVLPEDHDRTRANFREILAGGQSVPYEVRYTTADGRTARVEINTRPLVHDGRVVGLLGVSRDVTERARAEQTLRRSEAMYRALVEASPDAVAAADPEFHLVAASDRAYTMFGYTKDDAVLGRSLATFFPPDEIPRVRTNFEQTVREGLTRHIEYTMVRKDGTTFTGEVSAAAVRDAGGAVRLLIATIRDVTEQKRAEAALRESEARYRAVVDAQTELVNRFLPDGTVTFCNEACARSAGMKREELIGRNFFPFVDPEAVSHLRRALARVTPDHPVAEVEHRVIFTPGAARWMHWTNRGIFDDAGRLVEYQSIGRDITDRKRAEEALRQSEANYRAIFNAVNDIIFVDDIETGDVVDMNQRAVEKYGFGLDELDALNAAFRSRDDEPYTYQAEQECMRRAAEEGPQMVEWLARDRRGREFWVEVNVRRATIGGQDRLLSVLRDITDRKRAEDALRKSEEDYRLLFEQSVDGILVAAAGRIVRANRALADMVGEPADRLIGGQVLNLLHPDDREAAADHTRAVLAGDPPSPVPRRYRSLRADGSSGLVEIRSRRILWEGRPAVQSLWRDVTRQVHLEEQLQQAMKMEAVGQLAGGIAHDFNNLMTGILCHAGLLKSEAADPGAVRETADLIEGAARRAAALTSQLLGFARRGKQQDVPVDLAATVETSVRLLSRSLTPPIRIRTNFCHAPAYVRGDPVQMEQVVLNLAMNARDAMPDGGDITFALNHQDVNENHDRRPPHARPGRYLVLSITDTGCGIPGSLHDRVFEPFFTTKPQGKGTGMGLAMVYGIVRNHGGWIDIESAPSAGATFHVFLPATDVPAEPPPAAFPPPPRRPAARATGRILIVDDEAIVRNVLQRMLARRGYEVVTAGGGAEAVAHFRDDDDTVDLAIIDLRMPGMDGRECFQVLKALRPGIRAILATGGGPEVSIQDLLDEGVVTLIQKPFEADQLDEAIRKALAR